MTFDPTNPHHIHALRRACCAFQGAPARWAALAATGADDQTLIEALNKEINYGGSSGGPGWLWESTKSNPPQFWISDSIFSLYDQPPLRGPELLLQVRRLFGIGQPAPTGQLALF